MLTLWGRASAFNVQKAMFAIGELGLEHRHVEVGGSFGGLDDPEFLARNPNGRVPVIADGDAIVWESHSIIRYLAARYGAGSLWPEDPAQRSLADRWMDWTLANLGPDFMGLFWSFYRTPEAQRDAARIAKAGARCEAHFRILEAHLRERPFVAGSHFTMGDIPPATTLYRYFEMGHPVPDLPAVEAWYGRLAERPAFRASVMRPFAELADRLDF
jgi:glutathione S-transferase